MSWITRFGLVAFGWFLIFVALGQMRGGKLVVYDNANYHQQTFAASGIGVGIVFMLLAFLPSRNWLHKKITTKRRFGGNKKLR